MRTSRKRIVVSQAVGQLSLVAVLPVLTRSIPAADLGTYQAAFALGVLLQPLATLRIELFIPAMGSMVAVRRVRRLARRCILAAVLILALLACVLSFLGLTRPSVLAATALLVLAAYAVTAIDNAFLIHAGQLSKLANRNLMSGLIAAAGQLISAALSDSALLLGLSVIGGRFLAMALFPLSRGAPGSSAKGDGGIEWSVRRSLTAVASGTASIGAVQVLIFYAMATSGPAAVAQVGIAQRSAAAPLGLVSQGLAQVSQSHFGPLITSQATHLQQEFKLLVRRLFPFSLAVVVLLAVGGPVLAVPVFGDGWQEAGWYIAMLAAPCGLQLLLSPAMSIFAMIGSEQKLLALQAGRLLASVITAASLHFAFGDILWAVAGYAVASSAFYVVVFIVLWRLLGERDARSL